MSNSQLDLLRRYPIRSPGQAVALQKALDFLASMRRLEAMAGEASASLKDVSDGVLKLAEGDNADE